MYFSSNITKERGSYFGLRHLFVWKTSCRHLYTQCTYYMVILPVMGINYQPTTGTEKVHINKQEYIVTTIKKSVQEVGIKKIKTTIILETIWGRSMISTNNFNALHGRLFRRIFLETHNMIYTDYNNLWKKFR